MSNKRAVETLGMPQGTATNRLRKMVLFRQLVKYGDNVCVRCNVSHLRRGGEPRRIIGSEGTSWCIKCRIFHLIEFFSKDVKRWNGLRSTCRDQMKVYKDEYHESRRQKQEWSSGTTTPS